MIPCHPSRADLPVYVQGFQEADATLASSQADSPIMRAKPRRHTRASRHHLPDFSRATAETPHGLREATHPMAEIRQVPRGATETPREATHPMAGIRQEPRGATHETREATERPRGATETPRETTHEIRETRLRIM